VPNSPHEDADRPEADRRGPHPGQRAGEVSAAEDLLRERIERLDARLADASPDKEAQVKALYSGMRALVAELIRRRRQAEETCETLTQVLEATSDAFVALDANWRYTYVNEHAGRLFHRDPASLIGKHIWTEFPEGVGQPFQLEYERAVAEGTPRQIEAYYPPYGRWFENRIYPYAGGLAIFFQDVTERRTAEARLRESEQRYRSLFDRHPDAVYSFDADGRFVSANPACEKLSGYTPEELIGKPFAPVIAPEHRRQTLERFRAVMSGIATSYDETIIHKSGRRIEVNITALPIVVDGKVVGMYGIAKDLTARRELEARLRHAQKLEAVGRLAAGVAHDFNNLLTIIQSSATLITQELPASTQSHADAQEIVKASRRASELTQQLLAFSRKQVLQPQRVDVNQQITAFLGMLQRAIGRNIEVETQLAGDTWPVFADPGQLDRVLMNLGLNARDAMPNGGTLRLRTENVMLDPDSASEHPGLTPGAYVRIVVEDTGTGIPPAVLSKLFEPFVTTKPPGVGTGLGLSTAYGIVEQTGGAIQVSTTPGRGSRFSVYLPKAEDDVVPESAVA
jgi:PAS domain S-box-containing protein